MRTDIVSRAIRFYRAAVIFETRRQREAQDSSSVLRLEFPGSPLSDATE